MEPLPGSPLEVIEPEFLFQLLVGLFALLSLVLMFGTALRSSMFRVESSNDRTPRSQRITW